MNIDQSNDYKNKCLQIVQKYIEIQDVDGNPIKLNVEQFLHDCNYLNKSYYEDLTEERSSIDVCGYTLCDNRLSQTSKKQFKINQNYHIHNNKVYEITRRKNFCSDKCFKRSEFIKNQLSDEPYFLRKKDELLCSVKLYDGRQKQCGDEVKLIDSLTKSKPADEHKQATVDEFRKKLLNNEKKIESKLSSPYLKEEEFSELKDKFKKFNIVEKIIDETEKSIQFTQNENKEKEINEKFDNINYDDPLLDEIDRMSISTASSISNLSTISHSRRGKLKKQKFYENILRKISSWITNDTFDFLGIDNHKDVIEQNPLQEIIDNEDEKKKLERYRWEYIRLCAKLNAEEIEDEKYDRLVCNSKSKKNKKCSNVNKKSVFKNDDDCDENFSSEKLWNMFISPTIFSNCDDQKETKKVRFSTDDDVEMEQKSEDLKKEQETTLFLPLNDNQHAKVIRRQLFLKEIYSFLKEILANNNLEINDEIFNEIHLLIKTFNLNSNTVTLGRKQNFLISIFLFRFIIRFRMIEKSTELENIYKTNIFINAIIDRFNLTYDSIDESIDKIFSLNKD